MSTILNNPANAVLAKFASTGNETCFHDRHINPQIYADLNGSNWSIKDYEARGGYQALRKLLGKDGGEGLTQDQVIATSRNPVCAAVAVRASPRV
jgi:NADH-quinone oxidoreductase subunit F